MRANTKKKHGMGKRFALVIGAAAVGVMALGAQTAVAAPDYGSKLTITYDGGGGKNRDVLWHGGLRSEVRKCWEGRKVFLFQERRGADRQLGSDRANSRSAGWFTWEVAAPVDGRVYARVTPKVGDGFVCRADRSRTIKNGNLCFEDPSFCGLPRPLDEPSRTGGSEK